MKNSLKQPHLQITKGDINEYCLLPGDPARAERISLMLDDSRLVSEHRGYKVYNGYYKGVPLTVCSTGMGGPSIAIAIHELVNCGAKTLIRVGSSGSLQPRIKIGDTIVVEGAVRSESTTNLYYPREHPAYPNKDVLKALSRRGVKKGFINSHDGFYHKDSDLMNEFWSRIGLLAADFETAPLFIISEYLGVRSGSILNVVSEYNPKRIVRNYELINKAMNGEKKSIMIALSAIKKLSEED